MRADERKAKKKSIRQASYRYVTVAYVMLSEKTIFFYLSADEGSQMCTAITVLSLNLSHYYYSRFLGEFLSQNFCT